MIEENSKVMKATWIRNSLLVAAVIALILSTAGVARAQEDYPVPRGNPATWGIPGHRETLPEEAQGSPPSIFSAPRPRGNEALNGLSGPEGQAEEKYTGTRALDNGVAGTGIDRYGVPENW
jgi:hypothetical protein